MKNIYIHLIICLLLAIPLIGCRSSKRASPQNLSESNTPSKELLKGDLDEDAKKTFPLGKDQKQDDIDEKSIVDAYLKETSPINIIDNIQAKDVVVVNTGLNVNIIDNIQAKDVVVVNTGLNVNNEKKISERLQYIFSDSVHSAYLTCKKTGISTSYFKVDKNEIWDITVIDKRLDYDKEISIYGSANAAGKFNIIEIEGGAKVHLYGYSILGTIKASLKDKRGDVNISGQEPIQFYIWWFELNIGGKGSIEVGNILASLDNKDFSSSPGGKVFLKRLNTILDQKAVLNGEIKSNFKQIIIPDKDLDSEYKNLTVFDSKIIKNYIDSWIKQVYRHKKIEGKGCLESLQANSPQE